MQSSAYALGSSIDRYRLGEWKRRRFRTVEVLRQAVRVLIRVGVQVCDSHFRATQWALLSSHFSPFRDRERYCCSPLGGVSLFNEICRLRQKAEAKEQMEKEEKADAIKRRDNLKRKQTLRDAALERKCQERMKRLVPKFKEKKSEYIPGFWYSISAGIKFYLSC